MMQVRIRHDSDLLANHVVYGRGLFPAVGYLGLVTDALVASRNDGQVPFPVRFSAAKWLAPLWAPPGDTELKVTLEEPGTGGVYRIDAVERGQRVPYASGVVDTAGVATSATPDLPGDRASVDDCPDRYARSDIYRMFEALGLNYTGIFDSLETMRVGPNGAGAHVAVRQATGHPILEPGPLDAAIQAVLLHVHLQREPHRLYVPFSLEELICYGPVPTDCEIWLRAAEGGGDGQSYRYHVTLLKADGQRVAEMRDLCVAAFPEPDRRDVAAAAGKESWAVAATFTAEPLEAPLQF